MVYTILLSISTLKDKTKLNFTVNIDMSIKPILSLFVAILLSLRLQIRAVEIFNKPIKGCYFHFYQSRCETMEALRYVRN